MMNMFVCAFVHNITKLRQFYDGIQLLAAYLALHISSFLPLLLARLLALATVTAKMCSGTQRLCIILPVNIYITNYTQYINRVAQWFRVLRDRCLIRTRAREKKSQNWCTCTHKKLTRTHTCAPIKCEFYYYDIKMIL